MKHADPTQFVAVRTGYRAKALAMLVERRPFRRGGADWEYRTITAWRYLQMAMGIPSIHQTRTPPPVTVGGLT